jgi:hypothetical protein
VKKEREAFSFMHVAVPTESKSYLIKRDTKSRVLHQSEISCKEMYVF